MRRLAFAGCAALAATPAFAAQSGPAGAELARSVCAQCHAVGAEQGRHSPDPQAPRFVDVAQMPSTTELSLKVFLRSSHRNMPNLMLDENEIDAIAAYIGAAPQIGGRVRHRA